MIKLEGLVNKWQKKVQENIDLNDPVQREGTRKRLHGLDDLTVSLRSSRKGLSTICGVSLAQVVWSKKYIYLSYSPTFTPGVYSA